ncbi:MAG: MBL fold metallo-hydrolase [Thalassobaculaceae bacterium]
MINASPDLRAQILAHPALQPRDPGRFGLRDSPIGAVLLTNGDVDHVAGLLSLRESQAFDLFANATIHQVLRENPIFLALNPAFVAHKIAGLDQYFTLLPGFSRCQARCRFTLRAQGRWSPTRLSRKPSGWNCRPARRAFFMCRVAPRCPMTWPSASAAPSARLKTRTAAIT